MRTKVVDRRQHELRLNPASDSLWYRVVPALEILWLPCRRKLLLCPPIAISERLLHGVLGVTIPLETGHCCSLHALHSLGSDPEGAFLIDWIAEK